jgi:hypothetical protein
MYNTRYNSCLERSRKNFSTPCGNYKVDLAEANLFSERTMQYICMYSTYEGLHYSFIKMSRYNSKRLIVCIV